MKTTRLATDQCPECGYEVDAATAAGHSNAPSAGAVTICLRCGCWAMFGEDLRLRQLTVDERIAIAKDPTVQRLERAWHAVHAEMP